MATEALTKTLTEVTPFLLYIFFLLVEAGRYSNITLSIKSRDDRIPVLKGQRQEGSKPSLVYTGRTYLKEEKKWKKGREAINQSQ